MTIGVCNVVCADTAGFYSATKNLCNNATSCQKAEVVLWDVVLEILNSSKFDDKAWYAITNIPYDIRFTISEEFHL